MGKFQYHSRPTENWQQRSEQKGSGFIGIFKDSVNTYAVQKTENFMRILPPTWENAQHYGYDVWVHYGVGPQGATVLCLAKMGKGKCPVCEAWSAASDAGRDDAHNLKAGKRVLIWLLNRKEEAKGVLAWAMPWTLDRDISKLCRDRQTGELYQIDHPESGYDISFDREGEVPNVKYVGIQIARRPSPVDEKWLDFILANPLPSILQWRSYEEVAALLEGTDGTVDSGIANGAPAPAAVNTQPAANFNTTYTAEQMQEKQMVHEPSYATPATTATPVLCEKSFLFQGHRIACALPEGHPGTCDFQRDLGPLAQPAAAPGVTTLPESQLAPNVMVRTQVAPTTAVAPAAVNQSVSAPATTQTSPSNTVAHDARIDALRQRFARK